MASAACHLKTDFLTGEGLSGCVSVGGSVGGSGLDHVSFAAAQLLQLLRGLSLFPQ